MTTASAHTHRKTAPPCRLAGRSCRPACLPVQVCLAPDLNSNLCNVVVWLAGWLAVPRVIIV